MGGSKLDATVSAGAAARRQHVKEEQLIPKIIQGDYTQHGFDCKSAGFAPIHM